MVMGILVVKEEKNLYDVEKEDKGNENEEYLRRKRRRRRRSRGKTKCLWCRYFLLFTYLIEEIKKKQRPF